MFRPAVFVASLLFLVTACFAAQPIATISSAGPVTVSGTPMSASTVAFWPLASRDVIATADTSAVVILPDNSRITLNSNSRARVESDGDRMRFQLLNGSADYSLVTPTSAVFMVGNKYMADAAAAGSLGNKDNSGSSNGARRGDTGNPSRPPVVPPHHPSPVF